MTDLRKAAEAVLERWDSPAWEWKKQGPTADLMANLRTALAAEPTKPEPVAVVGTQSNEIWKRVYENWVRMPLPEPAKKVHLLRDLPVGTPLYAAPPEDIEALRRENERLREALEKVVAADDDLNDELTYICGRLLEEIKAALRREET